MPVSSSIVSDADRQQIALAITAAEQKTSAEICPAVAVASGRYDRAEDILGFWLALLTMAILWFVWPPLAPASDSWHETSPTLHLLVYLVAMVVAFIAGAVLGSYFKPIRSLFTPRREMTAEVLLRASSLFFDRRLHRTAGRTGILVFASLYERQAVILADDKVVSAIGQATLDQWCQEFTASLRTASLQTAFCQMIDKIGSRLAEPLPRTADDNNEISDALVVIE